jgi:signal peptidase
MIILAAIILAAGAVLGARVLGYLPLGVLSGSMEPAYHVGAVVFIDTNAKPEDIAVGDTIAFNLSEDTVVTHRVIAVDAERQQFTTKGDANNVEDMAPVPFGNMIGRAALHIPQAGYALMNLQTRKGFAVGAIVIAVLVALFAIPYIFSKPAGKGESEGGNAGGTECKSAGIGEDCEDGESNGGGASAASTGLGNGSGNAMDSESVQT